MNIFETMSYRNYLSFDVKFKDGVLFSKNQRFWFSSFWLIFKEELHYNSVEFYFEILKALVLTQWFSQNNSIC